jgi:hypothetical protein
MAEKGTWSSIKARGLLSTSAALDLVRKTGPSRATLERKHRPEKVSLGTGRARIVLRDQKPMTPQRLTMGLLDGITPSQWYQMLNGKVFMWAEETRLLGLLKARHYRALEHDVLVIDTKSLVRIHATSILLCSMNSGNTFPMPHRRGKDTFLRIENYPTRINGQPKKEVVEVVVDYSIPDISEHVVEVRRMRGDVMLRQLPL